MADVHVLFVPWERKDQEFIRFNDTDGVAFLMSSEGKSSAIPGYEYRSKNRGWKTFYGGKDVWEVWYNGKISPILLSMTGGGTIYLRGHGQLHSARLHSAKDALRAQDVGDRLIASGLQTGFRGSFKCYNCYSAEYGFAQELVDYLYGKGYTHCTYFGYRGALDSAPRESVGHKTSAIRDDEGFTTEIRAKDARVPIIPRQLRGF